VSDCCDHVSSVDPADACGYHKSIQQRKVEAQGTKDGPGHKAKPAIKSNQFRIVQLWKTLMPKSRRAACM
jgi:hypothetical protein